MTTVEGARLQPGEGRWRPRTPTLPHSLSHTVGSLPLLHGFPLYTGHIPLYTGPIPLYTGPIPLYTGHIPLYTGHIPLLHGTHPVREQRESETNSKKTEMHTHTHTHTHMHTHTHTHAQTHTHTCTCTCTRAFTHTGHSLRQFGSRRLRKGIAACCDSKARRSNPLPPAVTQMHAGAIHCRLL